MRRGFVFSLMALLITGVIVLFTVTDQQPDASSRTAVPEVREMNAIVSDIETDVQRGLYITSFRSLLAQIEYLITTGEFVNDSQASFEEAMLNGTIEGVELDTLNGTTFEIWLSKTGQILDDRGFEFTYAVLELEQTQESYDEVTARVVLTYNLSDSRGKRIFRRTVSSEAQVPIDGLEDPVYFVKSFGRISNSINFTNETHLPTLIDASENNSLYRASNKSPSFLMRLEGEFSASSYGIESIVNGERFIAQGVSNYDGRSSIDALYFSSIAHTPNCMTGTPSWFRLDDERMEDYSGATNTSC